MGPAWGEDRVQWINVGMDVDGATNAHDDSQLLPGE